MVLPGRWNEERHRRKYIGVLEEDMKTEKKNLGIVLLKCESTEKRFPVHCGRIICQQQCPLLGEKKDLKQSKFTTNLIRQTSLFQVNRSEKSISLFTAHQKAVSKIATNQTYVFHNAVSPIYSVDCRCFKSHLDII